MDILVNVTNQKLKVATNQKTFVAGTQEFIRFVFELSEDWLQLLNFVQFQQNNESYNVYLDEENAAYLPPEIQSGEMIIALQGNLNKTIAKSSTLTFSVNTDPIKSDANSTEITLSLYDQLAGSIVGIEANVDALKERMVALEKNEVVLDEIHSAVESTMEKYLADGEFAAMTIGDGTISRKKIDEDFEKNIKDLELKSQQASWTADQIDLLETILSHLAYDDETSGQTAANKLIASLRGDTTNDDITVTVGDGKIATDATSATVSDGKIILLKEA